MTEQTFETRVERALEPLRMGLSADGVELVSDGMDGPTLKLRLVAGEEACQDCFVPPKVMEQMALDSLRAEGADVAEVEIRTVGFDGGGPA